MSRTHDCGCGGSCCTSHRQKQRPSRLSLDVRVNGCRVLSRDAAGPAPLYVSRALLPDCARSLAAWARAQGLRDVTDPTEMHVTVAYSRAPVDWFAIRTGTPSCYVPLGGPRRLEAFKGGVVVLRFAAPALKAAWEDFRRAGCSWDWPDYAPHVTVAAGAGRAALDRVPAYAGALEFGPETFGPVKD